MYRQTIKQINKKINQLQHNQTRRNAAGIVVVFIVCFIVSINLVACGSLMNKSQTEQPQKDKLEFAGDMLTFSEVLTGQEETNVRMIITKGYLRIDDGPQAEDYLLFDREKKIIYNIVSDEKTVLVMSSSKLEKSGKLEKPEKETNAVTKPPYPILWNVESQTSNALMRTDDKAAASATHYRLKLNQKECYNLVTVDQGMEKPLAAIREYRQALAEQLKKNYAHQKDQECYEAVNIFTPLNHLHQGFPMREWSAYGYQRFLVNYRKMIIFPKRLFELPKNYTYSQI